MMPCHDPYLGDKPWTADSHTYESRFFDNIVAIYLSVWKTGKVRDADTVEDFTYEWINSVATYWSVCDSDLADVVSPCFISLVKDHVFVSHDRHVSCEPGSWERRDIKQFVSHLVDTPINMGLVKHIFRHGPHVFVFRLYHYLYVMRAWVGHRAIQLRKASFVNRVSRSCCPLWPRRRQA